MASVQATILLFPFLCATTVVDLDTLYQDILSALSSDLTATKYIPVDSQWSTDSNGLLYLDNRIYILSAGNLHTHVLQHNHNHILAEHFSQNKTLKLVCCEYSWPSLYTDIQQFYKSYITYMWSKHNVTNLIDLLSNFLSPNGYRILFLWTSSRNSCYPLYLTLFWS